MADHRTGEGRTRRTLATLRLVTAHVQALVVEVHVPASASLKAKRAVVRSIVDGARHRFGLAVAETDHLDRWQRAQLTFCAVSGSAGHTVELIDRAERFVWSFPDVEVLEATRVWLETDT
ncbi:MAG: DUF503 domain-containing protein [Acidimicrobiia bacterium]|nr:DUF503 domain-containing protein [Acidimicrobiia bacterium]